MFGLRPYRKVSFNCLGSNSGISKGTSGLVSFEWVETVLPFKTGEYPHHSLTVLWFAMCSNLSVCKVHVSDETKQGYMFQESS